MVQADLGQFLSVPNVLLLLKTGRISRSCPRLCKQWGTDQKRPPRDEGGGLYFWPLADKIGRRIWPFFLSLLVRPPRDPPRKNTLRRAKVMFMVWPFGLVGPSWPRDVVKGKICHKTRKVTIILSTNVSKLNVLNTTLVRTKVTKQAKDKGSFLDQK